MSHCKNEGTTRLYTWEVWGFSISENKHVKRDSGSFQGGSVMSMVKKMATYRAKYKGEMIKGKWYLEKPEHKLGDIEGRVYKKQAKGRPHYANLNPIIYLTAGKEIKRNG